MDKKEILKTLNALYETAINDKCENYNFSYAEALGVAIDLVEQLDEQRPCPHCETFAKMQMSFNMTGKTSPKDEEMSKATHCCFCGRKLEVKNER